MKFTYYIPRESFLLDEDLGVTTELNKNRIEIKEFIQILLIFMLEEYDFSRMH